MVDATKKKPTIKKNHTMDCSYHHSLQKQEGVVVLWPTSAMLPNVEATTVFLVMCGCFCMYMHIDR